SCPSPELDYFHRTVNDHSGRRMVLQHDTVGLSLDIQFAFWQVVGFHSPGGKARASILGEIGLGKLMRQPGRGRLFAVNLQFLIDSREQLRESRDALRAAQHEESGG